jgi:hypothetical protein
MEGLAASSEKALPQEYPPKAQFLATLVLDVASLRVHGDVLGHPIVRIEVDRLIASGHSLLLRVDEQCLADALTLLAGVDRYVIDEKALVCFRENKHPSELAICLSNDDVLLPDDQRIVLQHGPWLATDALDPRSVGGLDASIHCRGIPWKRLTQVQRRHGS